MTGRRFAGHDPKRGHDTAGVPWAGRTLVGTGFGDDSGAADPALLEALADPSDEIALVGAVSRARLLVPVVALPGEMVAVSEASGAAHGEPGARTSSRLRADASSDMAAVTLVAPDGARALPAFTSLSALAAWDSTARPVPVTAQRAALAAVQESCGTVLLDLGSVHGAGRGGYALRSSMVWALAMDRPWQPAHLDSAVDSAVAATLTVEPAATAYALAAGSHGALQVTLTLGPGLRRDEVQALVTRVGERLAADGEVRPRIDALSFTLRDNA